MKGKLKIDNILTLFFTILFGSLTITTIVIGFKYNQLDNWDFIILLINFTIFGLCLYRLNDIIEKL